MTHATFGVETGAKVSVKFHLNQCTWCNTFKPKFSKKIWNLPKISFNKALRKWGSFQRFENIFCTYPLGAFDCFSFIECLKFIWHCPKSGRDLNFIYNLQKEVLWKAMDFLWLKIPLLSSVRSYIGISSMLTCFLDLLTDLLIWKTNLVWMLLSNSYWNEDFTQHISLDTKYQKCFICTFVIHYI